MFLNGKHIIAISVNFRLREIETQRCTIECEKLQALGSPQYFDQLCLCALRAWKAVFS